MKTLRYSVIAALFGSAIYAQAAPGVYWDITTRTDISGLTIAMPAETHHVCLEPGAERDPKRLQDATRACQYVDIRQSGDQVSWQASCTLKNIAMNGAGVMNYTADTLSGNISMAAAGNNGSVAVKVALSGHRTGESCEASPMPPLPADSPMPVQ